jgi:hypothetical protein
VPGQLRKRMLVLLTGIGLAALIAIPLIAESPDSVNGSTFNPAVPQCGHWAILRCCELLGVPIEMQTILKLLPPNERGTSMLELRGVFKRIGLKTIGKRETLEGLIKGPYPAVAHLTGDHFVTVSVADDEVVRLFDGGGRVSAIKLSDFGKGWDGTLLVIQRTNRAVPLPSFANRSRKNVPCIEFDTLIIDKGDVPWHGKPIVYEFPICNTGEAPLVIQDIKTNCGCLGAVSPGTPIAPGGKGMIALKYSVKAGQGPFKHEALVKSNDPSVPLVKLTAAGNTDVSVEITPKYVYLGRIVPGQRRTATVSVHFTGDSPLEIREVSCENKQLEIVYNLLSQELARELRHGITSREDSLWILANTYVLQITYEAGIRDLGKTAIDTVVIHTNIDEFKEISVPVFAEVVNPVRLYPSTLLFTGIKPDEIATKAVEVVSLDGRPFQIISVKAENDEIDYYTDPGFAKRKTLSLSAKGLTLLSLSDTSLEIEVEVRGALPKRHSLKLPIYAN